MNTIIYPILTLSVATLISYFVYKRSKEQIRCPYNFFESRLIEILHKEASKSSAYVEFCKLSTAATRKDFFMKKIQAANALIDGEDYEGSINLLIEAMAVCSRPVALLQCMSNILPLDVYRKLIEKLSNLS